LVVNVRPGFRLFNPREWGWRDPGFRYRAS
jgi:hypothetical protein